MKLQVSLKSIVGATALAGGLWLATLNPAQSCPFSELPSSGDVFGGKFPTLNWSKLDWKNIGPLTAGIMAGLLGAGAIAYRVAKVKATAAPEVEAAIPESSFSIPVYLETLEETDASQDKKVDQLTSSL